MSSADRTDRVAAYFRRSAEVLAETAENAQFQQALGEITELVVNCFRDGGKVLVAGNGGSAADAQHIAGEFLSRLNFDRHPLPAIALTTDSSVLTAVGNDYGYERVFERQVRGLGRRGDVFIAISTSGNSPNIVAALEAAREIGVATVGFTGNRDGAMVALCDSVLRVPSVETPQIQQIHIVAAHIICGEAERSLFQAPND
ncbi:MAG TPA: D-sedoheptulose 7-phosphate isomerase [Xanthobacteraceae bacterium]|nr:D-sedoheptulose 7-phosphate isomerase [Xanthobacteraceae bacterium]